MQADPYAERLGFNPIPGLDGALHLNRARDGVGAGSEHDHEPITDVFHLPPGVVGHRAPQQPEVRTPQLVGSLVAEAVE